MHTLYIMIVCCIYLTARTGSVNMHIIMWLTRKKNIVREDGQLKVGVEIYKIILKNQHTDHNPKLPNCWLWNKYIRTY